MKFSSLNKNKGITPIIAVVLLLMMVVAGASAAFFWFIRMQSEIQSGTEQYQENVYEKISSSLSWENSDYDDSTGLLTFYIQNTGNLKIPVKNTTAEPTTFWIIKDSDQTTVCSTKWDAVYPNPPCTYGCGENTKIQIGETKEIRINISNSECNVSSYSSNDIFYVSIYFSGKANVAGTFEK